jgi:N-acetylornithine carbamoyltransferase
MKNFITGTEFSKAELQEIINLAIAYKNGSQKLPDFSSKLLTLIFANPSLRTRLSFESGMKKLKGEVNVLSASDSWEFEYQDGVVMNENKQEHIKEAAQVISKYTDLIALRKSDLMTKSSSTNISSSWNKLKEDQAINQLAKYANKPIINMESNMFHPCQSMADMQTMVEHFGHVENKKYVLTWVPHPKPLPLATPHSQILTPNIFGMDVTLACPKGFELDSDVVSLAEKHGGEINIEHDQEEAFKDADVIMAKSWVSLQHFGAWDEEVEYRKQFSNWTVTQNKMRLTNDAIFMHCLPVRRNVIVTDEVLDSSSSVVIEEAENRMWSQMAIISKLFSF